MSLQNFLPKSKIYDLFTIVVDIDLDLKIISMSPLLCEYAPEISIGSDLCKEFEMIRPGRVSKESIASKVDMMYLMISKQSRYPIRGQLVSKEGGDGYLLLGSPWLSRLESDGVHSYEMQHFSGHDAQLDWLFMLASEQQRVRDLEKLSTKLKVAKADAESANAAKSSFFAVMSHEMRTPLNAVIGAMNLLKDEELEPEQNELLKMGISASKHLLTVINDVLDMSKIEAGKMTLENNIFDTHEMLDDIKSICHSRAIGKSLQLHTSIGIDVPRYIRADDGKLKQILINLIGNAIKFTDYGKVTVHIEMFEKMREKGLMRISIIDTGKGISEKYKDKLFNEFWTSKSGRDFYTEGTGLGLDISKRLVHLMGGEINFSSVEGEGSTFWIDIPIVVEEENKFNRGDVELHFPVVENTFHGKRALLAEDNQANQLIGKLYMERMGFTVDIANNGLEVIELLKSNLFDIVLMDLGMPVMDGVETTKYIRNELHLIELPIVACTAHSFTNDIKNLLQKGFNEYVPKPINRNELQRVVVKLLPLSSVVNSEVKSRAQIDLVINEGQLDQLLDEVGKENASLVLDTFLTELDKRLASIENASSRKDVAKIFAAVHALKSTAYSYGAIKLGDLLTQIELAASNDASDVFKRVKELIFVSSETHASIVKYKNKFHY